MGYSMVQFRDAIRDEIAKQMQATANKIASGKAADYAEYRQSVGRVAGGKDAMDAVDDVFKRMFNDGDED